MTAFNPAVATESKQYAYDPQSAPPPFGHALLPYFAFSSSYTNLNHGSYGSLPLPVQTQVDTLGAEAESNPDLWHRLTYYPRLTVAREQIARLIGAKVEECVIVGNASTGINVVLRNFAWNDGDVLVGATTTYGSIDKTLLYLHDIHPKTVLRPFTLHFPTSHANIIENWRKHLRSLPRADPSESNPKPKIVAVIDSIVSNPGALLPWKEMVKICKEEGVWSVIDAAHSIGQEVGVNLAEAQPDFWISNCHKWLYAKRGCAVLYVPERNRHIIKTSFPTSHFYKKEPTVEDWLHQFDWNGTIDFVPFLSVTPALAFRAWLGGEEVINTYCHDLALSGGAALAKVLGTSMMGNAEEITLNMVNVELPLPHDSFDNFAMINKTLVETMLRKQGVYAAHYYHDGKWWTRASAQVWNEVSDFEKLGHAFVEVCQQIREQLSSKQG